MLAAEGLRRLDAETGVCVCRRDGIWQADTIVEGNSLRRGAQERDAWCLPGVGFVPFFFRLHARERGMCGVCVGQ